MAENKILNPRWTNIVERLGLTMADKNFTRQVLQIVSSIPTGKLMTYSSVAKKAGSPRAYRAVGNILNRNYREQEWQLPVIRGQIIPCHRVIRADGQIGNYAKGIKAKEELLEKEGHVVDNHEIKLINLV